MFLSDCSTEILHKYRVHCSPESSRGQLILPDSLKLLPLFTLCALKHPAFLDNFADKSATTGAAKPAIGPGMTAGIASGVGKFLVRGNERAFELRKLRSLPTKQVSFHF